MYTKQLLEDVNSIVNTSRTSSGNENLKSSAIKTLEKVTSKYKKLISQGKYNLVISSLKRLTEDIDQLNEMGVGGQDREGSGIDPNKTSEYEELSKTSNAGSSRIDPKAMKNKIMNFLVKADRIKQLVSVNKIPAAFSIYKKLSLNEEYIQEINISPNKYRYSVNFRYDENVDKEVKDIIKKIENLNSDKQAKLFNIITSSIKMDPEDADKLAAN